MQILTGPSEFRELKKWTESHLPGSMVLNAWLKVNLDRPDGIGTSPYASCFIDQWPNPTVAIGVDLVSLYHLPQFPCLCLYADSKRANCEIIQRILLEISQEIDLPRIGGIKLRGVSDRWVPACDQVFKNQLRLNASVKYWNNKIFCVPKEKHQRLLAETIQAADGFQFDVLNDHEIDFVDDAWPHQHVGSKKLIKRRIGHFPNVCLRDKRGERLASFELVDDMMGIVNHLYTVPEYRGKRLAQQVETALIQKMVKAGYYPVKTVLLENEPGQKATLTNPWWTCYVETVSWMRYGDSRLVQAYQESPNG